MTIDKKATRKNVVACLSNYANLLDLANDTGLKSAWDISETRKAHIQQGDKNMLKLIQKRQEAQRQLEEIEEVITCSLTLDERQRLVERFMTFPKPRGIDCADNAYMSERNYYKLLNQAMIAFATVYQGGRLLVTK